MFSLKAKKKKTVLKPAMAFQVLETLLVVEG